ncbi:MAG TPA: M48 family metalloprotease, partial [Vicinamibacteria bacterium]|nr:M48 family metalloprotease [Vicinamibacteria bacterium]
VSYYSSRQKNPITGRTQAIALSPKQEVALGLRTAPQMAQRFGGEDPDATAQALVRSVGEKLVRGSAASSTPYEYKFTLLADSNTVNAFALPGGPIFITRALYDRLGNEAQLAGVLGHEIGHVVGRHSAEKLAKSRLGQTIVGAVGVATSDEYGRRGGMAQAAAAMVNQMVQLKYGREDELQSDSLGVRFMGDGGYDPRALIDVMDVLAKAGGGRKRSEFLSSHPDPGNRSQTIRAEIDKLFPGGVPARLTTGSALPGARAAATRPN